MGNSFPVGPFSNLQAAIKYTEERAGYVKKQYGPSESDRKIHADKKDNVKLAKDVSADKKSTVVQKEDAKVTDLGQNNIIYAEGNDQTSVKTDMKTLENTLSVLGKANEMILKNVQGSSIIFKGGANGGNNKVEVTDSKNVSILSDKEDAEDVYFNLQNATGTNIENHASNAQFDVLQNSTYNQVQVGKDADGAKVKFTEHSDYNNFKINDDVMNAKVEAHGGSDGNMADISGDNSQVQFTKDADGSTVQISGANANVTLEGADNLDIAVTGDDENVKVFTKNGKQYLQKLNDQGQPTGNAETVEFKNGEFTSADGKITIKQKSKDQRVGKNGLLNNASDDKGTSTSGKVADPSEYKNKSWTDARNYRKAFNGDKKKGGGPGELSADISDRITDNTYKIQNGDGLRDIALGVYRANNPEETANQSDVEIAKAHRADIDKIQNKIAKDNGIKDQNMIGRGDKLKLNGVLEQKQAKDAKADSVEKFDTEAQKPFKTITTSSKSNDPDPKNIQNLANMVNTTGADGKKAEDYLGKQVGVVEHGDNVTIYYANGALTYEYEGTVDGKSNEGKWALDSVETQQFDKAKVADIQEKQEAADAINTSFKGVDENSDGFLNAEELGNFADTQTETLKQQINMFAENVATFSKANADYSTGTQQSPEKQITSGLSSADIQAIQNLLAIGMTWEDINKELAR